MAQPDDDDTSTGQVTQGGHTPHQGHSIWWVMGVLVVAVAVGLFVLSTHKHAPDEHGTVRVSSAAGDKTLVRVENALWIGHTLRA